MIYHLTDGMFVVKQDNELAYLFRIGTREFYKMNRAAYNLIEKICLFEDITENNKFLNDLIRKNIIALGSCFKDDVISDLLNKLCGNPKLNGVYKNLLNIFSVRKIISREYYQLPALPSSTLKRAKLIMNNKDIKKLVLLGDDDLTSIALLCLQKMGGRKIDMTVIDIDNYLLDFIKTISTFYLRLAPPETVNIDLRGELPSGFLGVYDAFITDPEYTNFWFDVFISRGISMIKEGGLGYFFGPRYAGYGPLLNNDIMKVLRKNSIKKYKILKKFNRYFHPDVDRKGNLTLVSSDYQTDLWIIKK